MALRVDVQIHSLTVSLGENRTERTHCHDITIAEPRGHTLGNKAAQWRTITRVLEEHNRTDTRWLSYELDAAKLLDFPS